MAYRTRSESEKLHRHKVGPRVDLFTTDSVQGRSPYSTPGTYPPTVWG